MCPNQLNKNKKMLKDVMISAVTCIVIIAAVSAYDNGRRKAGKNGVFFKK